MIEKMNDETNEEGKKWIEEGMERRKEIKEGMQWGGKRTESKGREQEGMKERNEQTTEGRKEKREETMIKGTKYQRKGWRIVENTAEHRSADDGYFHSGLLWVHKMVAEKVTTHSTNTNPHRDTLSIQSSQCNERLEQVWSVTTKPKKQHESHLFRRRGISGVVQHCPLLFTVWSAQSDQWCVWPDTTASLHKTL